MSAFTRISFALALLGTLAACGFHLRGSTTLPFKTLWVAFNDASPLGTEFRRYIRSGTSTQLVSDPAKAEALLEVLDETRDRDILSLNSAGQVREYNLFYRFRFRVHDGKGHDLIPPTEIVLKRNITVDEQNLLAKTAEEALLYRDMQSDLVQQLLRRLAAIRVESDAAAAPSMPATGAVPIEDPFAAPAEVVGSRASPASVSAPMAAPAAPAR